MYRYLFSNVLYVQEQVSVSYSKTEKGPARYMFCIYVHKSFFLLCTSHGKKTYFYATVSQGPSIVFFIILLTLSPTAEKRRPHHGIGLIRPRATTIVVGIYTRCRVLSLVPVYEVCVCEWLDQRRGPLKTFHLHRYT